MSEVKTGPMTYLENLNAYIICHLSLNHDIKSNKPSHYVLAYSNFTAGNGIPMTCNMSELRSEL